MPELSERDMRILAFERRGWRSPGLKEQAIAEVLGMPATRYYQLLNELTGRPAADAVALGGLETVPGLVVLGHYGWQRWQDGELATTPAPPAVEQARAALPGVLRAAGAPDGTWVEDKEHAVAVHTRGTAGPQAALDRLREPLGELAARLGLAAEPGRYVIELRPPGVDKGSALTGLAGERT